MTMDTYSHVLPSIQQEAMRKLDDLFHGNRPNEDEKNNDFEGNEK